MTQKLDRIPITRQLDRATITDGLKMPANIPSLKIIDSIFSGMKERGITAGTRCCGWKKCCSKTCPGLCLVISGQYLIMIIIILFNVGTKHSYVKMKDIKAHLS